MRCGAEAGAARTWGTERLARRFLTTHGRPTSRRSRARSANWRCSRWCAATASRNPCSCAPTRSYARTGSIQTPISVPSSTTPLPRATATCSDVCGTCSKPAAGCSSSPPSPICRPTCAGCMSRTQSRSSSSAPCIAPPARSRSPILPRPCAPERSRRLTAWARRSNRASPPRCRICGGRSRA